MNFGDRDRMCFIHDWGLYRNWGHNHDWGHCHDWGYHRRLRNLLCG
jgi:hypothetical protein